LISNVIGEIYVFDKRKNKLIKKFHDNIGSINDFLINKNKLYSISADRYLN